MYLGLLCSPNVQHDLCWMESIRLGHIYKSVVAKKPLLESRVVNFVSKQHICGCLATVRAGKCLLYDAVKDFIHLEK